ncbi:MAG: Tol-Pal system-associated acyl-CoA thioesterase [Burkholderiaceae bacterium]|jgi:acyl-CoA thioester hydrolase|nr:MAG: Tol-Pal system-associated acyl-CoA thioesterase [Burkholderiaceae bacterium]
MTGERGLFTLPVRVYWEDTDAGGIVFYANYLKFFERARTEWLRSFGIEQRRLREERGGLFVVVESQVRYRRPARLDDILEVSARLEAAGHASFTVAQHALLKSERAESDAAPLLCSARIRIGWVDAATLRPARIPQSILEVLQE